MAAPRRPAPTPQPRPLASAWVAVEAMLPVTASAASATAAILVLIDMRNSIRVESGTVVAHMPVGRSVLESGSNPTWDLRLAAISLLLQLVSGRAVSPWGRPKAYPYQICRCRPATRKMRARHDRAGVRLSLRKPASHPRRRRFDEGPGPA